MRNAPGRDTAVRRRLRRRDKWKTRRQGRGIFSDRTTCSLALTLSAIAVGGILQVLPAAAIEFDDGELWGSIDTTLSHGLTFRVQKRDEDLADNTNSNDGNLNYKRGLVSNTSKFTIDLDINTSTFGAFLRTTGFLDFENQYGSRERTPLSEAAKKAVGRNVELLDAYITTAYDIGDVPVDLRLGKHVLNWGESTFIPNGINAINHYDVSKLRLPGSELREALLPVSMVSASASPTANLSVEAFYQLDWEETKIDPVGSYFSSTDYAGPGARKAVITQVTDLLQLLPGACPRGADLGCGLSPETFDPDFASVLRGPDLIPPDSGQWGIAARFLAEDLNLTEFGFYFMNYHSRLPVISARQGPVEGINAGLAAANAITANPPQLPPGVTIEQVASGVAINAYGKSATYSLEYPADIRLFGASFNTVLGASGWALQGEYSLRQNAPLQVAERVVLTNGLAPIGRALALASNPTELQTFLDEYTPEPVQGYVEHDVSQFQVTATKVFGPTLSADALVFVAEAAMMRVHNMPTTPIESPAGGILPGQPPSNAQGAHLRPEVADADAMSWGYRIAARLDYNNAIGSINLYPYTQFLHDVSGNSPAPSGPFIEGRTGLTLGLSADYLSSWQADLSYTRYDGDGYALSDRDFISASLKYSF